MLRCTCLQKQHTIQYFIKHFDYIRKCRKEFHTWDLKESEWKLALTGDLNCDSSVKLSQHMMNVTTVTSTLQECVTVLCQFASTQCVVL